jgi:transposase
MIHKIKALYDNGNGYSIRNISKELGISRKTVSKYLQKSEVEINNLFETSSRSKVLDHYRIYIIYLLQKYPKLSATKVKNKLKAKGIEDVISERTFRRYIRELKNTIPVKQQRYYEPVIDMVPGIQCQIDLGELRAVSIGGIETTVYFAVFVLSYSRIMYVTTTDKPISTKDFIQMHDNAFSYFGGVVEECVYDQTKLVAIKEEFREVWFNEEFYRYATYCKFEIRVCEGYDPESKGKVEAGVKYVKNSFFYAEQFDSIEDLNSCQLKWLNEAANVRIHGTTKRKPEAAFDAEERAKLKPYLRPLSIIIESQGVTRAVDKTSLLSYKSNKYSVPMKYQSSKVMLKEEQSRLLIFDIETKQSIAEHMLSEGKGLIVKNLNHYRDLSIAVKEREREVYELIGKELSEPLCSLIKATSPKIYKDQLVGVIKLIKIYKNKSNFKEELFGLIERPQLKVSFMKEYLEALYSKDKVCDVVNTINKVSAEHRGRLSSYECLLQQGEM